MHFWKIYGRCSFTSVVETGSMQSCRSCYRFLKIACLIQ